jgi:formamidopyrimidine-DNA glycosylase
MTGQIVYVGHKQIEDRRLGIEEPVSSNQIEDRFGAGHPSDSLIDNLPDKSTHVEFWFKDSSKLYFNDQRKFGWVKLLPTALIPEDPFMMKVGPEPLGDDLPAEVFMTRIKKRKGTNVKAAILDQTVLAGVGNIYADESLWAAKIHPATKVSELSDNDLTNLRDEIVAVLQLAIDKGGSTDKNYVDAEGKKGSYIEFAKVFRREGQDCKRCGTTIDKIRVAGRGTHICSVCQEL